MLIHKVKLTLLMLLFFGAIASGGASSARQRGVRLESLT